MLKSRTVREYIQWLFPRSDRPHQQTWVFFLFAIPFSLVILGIEMTSNYEVVKRAFRLAWIFAIVTLWIALTILSQAARIIWSAIGGIIFGALLLLLFWYLCPNLVIRPTKQVYRASDDLYIFRVTNPTSSELYANAFIFHLNPDTYSSNDFELRIEPRFLNSLEQQSDNSNENVSDIFAVSGEDSRDRPILIVYVYRLAPKESREIGLKFNGYIVPGSTPAEVNAGIMSYSDSPLPIGKKEGDIVTIPIGMELPLTIDRMFSCSLNASGSSSPECSFHRVSKKGEIDKTGCYYLAFVKGRDLPNTIPNANFSGSCDIKNFKTR